MAREIKHINKFDGGLNNASDPTDIEENQVASVKGFDFSKNGRIRPMGRCEEDSSMYSVYGNLSPGYGFNVFRSSYSFQPPSTNGVNITQSITTQGITGEKAYFYIVFGDYGHTLANISSGGVMGYGDNSSNYDNDIYFTLTVDGGSIITEDNPVDGGLGAGQFPVLDRSDRTPDYYDLWSAGFNSSGVVTLCDNLITSINVGTGSHGWVASEYPGNERGVLVEKNVTGAAYNDQVIMTWFGWPSIFITNVSTYCGPENVVTTGDSPNFARAFNATGGVTQTTEVHRLTFSGNPKEDEIVYVKIEGQGGGAFSHTVSHTVTAGQTNENVRDAFTTLLNTAIGGGQPLNGKISHAESDTDGYHIDITSSTAGAAGSLQISNWVTGNIMNAIDAEIFTIVDKYGDLKINDKSNTTPWSAQFNDIGWGSDFCKPVLFVENSLLRLCDADYTGTFTDSTCDYNNDPTISMDSTRNLAVGMTVTGTGVSGTISSIASNGTDFELSASTTGGSVTNGTLTFTFDNANRVVGPIYKPYLFNSQRSLNEFCNEENKLSAPSTTTLRERCDSPLTGTIADKTMEVKIVASSSDGNWDGTYKFYASCVYDDGQESLPSHVFLHNTAETLAIAEQSLEISIQCDHGASGTSNYAFPLRQTGFRIYWSEALDGHGEKNLLGTIDFREGFIRSDGGATVGWRDEGSGSPEVVVASSGSSAEVMTIGIPPEVETFELINGYSHKNSSLTARYKTIAFGGRRAFIGNVRYGASGSEVIYPDRIIISPPNQVDVFPAPYNVLQTSVSDGDSIVKLETYEDFLLEFKRNSLYIHNIASGDPGTFFLERSLKFLGINGHNAAVKTPHGIFWVNSLGAYLFDGNPAEIKYLAYYGDRDSNSERISQDTFTTYGANASGVMCGYDPSSDTVIVKKTYEATTTSGIIMTYSFKNDTFSLSSSSAGQGVFVDGKATTNFANNTEGELILGVDTPLGTPDGEDGGAPR